MNDTFEKDLKDQPTYSFYFMDYYKGENVYVDWYGDQDEDDPYVIDRCNRLTLYNAHNTNVFNSAIAMYIDWIDVLPKKEEWQEYIKCRESIAIGEDQTTIYNNLVTCFGQKIVDVIITDKDAFIDGVVIASANDHNIEYKEDCNEDKYDEEDQKVNTLNTLEEDEQYYLSPYNSNSERSLLVSDHVINDYNLKMYNSYNYKLLNTLLYYYKMFVGKFPQMKDWHMYMDIRRSIASGDDQSIIYSKIIDCFGKDDMGDWDTNTTEYAINSMKITLKKYIPNVQAFCKGIVDEYDVKIFGFNSIHQIQTSGYIIGYNRSNPIYHQQAELRSNDLITEKGYQNLKKFNSINYKLYNCLIHLFWNDKKNRKMGKLKHEKYVDTRRSIVMGNDQSKIYDSLISYFGRELITKFIPNNGEFVEYGTVDFGSYNPNDFLMVGWWYEPQNLRNKHDIKQY